MKGIARVSAQAAEVASAHLTSPGAGNAESVARFEEVVRAGTIHVVSVADIESLPLGSADQKVKQAIILPVISRVEDRVIAILIAGINPTRQLDSEYQTFYDLISGHVATAISNARAYQEERKRAEALAELDRAKTTFFSNVSHEFRTPLTLMLGPLEDLLAKPADPATAEDRPLLEVAHRNGVRLLKLVNTLLDFSRIEAGRGAVSYRPVDLAKFTTELAGIFRSATDRAGLKLSIACRPLPRPVYVDVEMWEKIVLNLISNAFKFTFDGEISVLLQDRDGGAELIVSDTGIGIPAKELPRIFDRFHRVESNRGRSHEGSGIGLSLVQELVKLNGGSIDVVSEPSVGTRFRVQLPYGTSHLPQHLLSEKQAAIPQGIIGAPYIAEALSWIDANASEFDTQDTSYAGHLSGEIEEAGSVLVVDDNPDMRHYVARLLAGRFRVIAADNGKAALELALKEQPDLVLTDVMMPEMNGFELLAELRSNPATATIPIILLSARAGEESRIEGLQRGADDYLVKPFSARELLARVENNLTLAHLRRDAENRIKESEARFRALVAASSDLIYRTSPDWSEMRQLGSHGKKPDAEFANYLWIDTYIHPDDRTPVLGAIQEAIRKKINFELEHRVLRADGTVGWTFSRAVPILDANGEILEWFGAASDITSRKQAEQALLRSEKLASVGRMAASISHEINNPLEAVTNTLFLAQTVDGLPEAAHQFLEVADGELKRVAHITRQALGFYRESNAPTVTSINSVLDSTVELLSAKVKAKSVVLQKDWKAEVSAKVVAGELRQVFSNLLANSLDAVDEHGVVKLRCSAMGSRNGSKLVRVTIADNGKGISPELKPHLFEAFFTTKGSVGTGLGLWVSKQLVEKHGGRIRVRSGTDGRRRGTTFSVVFPTDAAKH